MSTDISDGFGNFWPRCKLGNDCGLRVIRPGKAKCWCCDTDESREMISKNLTRLRDLENIEDDLHGEVYRLTRENAALRTEADRLKRTNAQLVRLAAVADQHIAELKGGTH